LDSRDSEHVGDGVDVSVVICAYNEAGTLDECLRSVLAQDYPGTFEVVVVDDGSTDGTEDVYRRLVAELPSATALRVARIEHGGLSVARNTGVELARGSVVAFHDADGKARPTWLYDLVGSMAPAQTFAVAAGPVDNENNGSFFARFIHRAHFRASLLSASSRVIGANMAFTRDVFTRTGGFIDAFQSRGDEVGLMAIANQIDGGPVETYSDQAWASNEHPERLLDWLRIQFFEGKMMAWIERDVSLPRSAARRLIGVAVRALSLTAYSMPVFVALGLPASFVLVPLGPWIIRHSIRVAYFRVSVAEVFEHLGASHVFLIPPVLLAGVAARDLGYLMSLFGTERIDLTQSTGRIEFVLG
jgi:cellulose synthase/poly-beta-1,6-N-acetylglucosamine synthase-like glycosyltransferase